MKKAVFIDRDGTINWDREGYISDPNDLELYDFAIEAIKNLNSMGFKVIVVTNQSGIARGYYTVEQLEKVNGKMIQEFKNQGAIIDAVYFSPWHREGFIDPYNRDHEDRKPGIGMYKQALEKFNIEPSRSYMIGDRESDIGFGCNAGLKSILVRTGNGDKEFVERHKNWIYKPDFITENLLSAAKLIAFLEEKNK